MGVRKCRGSQKTGNYLNYLRKIKKMAKSRFWGRFEQESVFSKSDCVDFFKFKPDLVGFYLKTTPKPGFSHFFLWFQKIQIISGFFRYGPISNSKKPKSYLRLKISTFWDFSIFRQKIRRKKGLIGGGVLKNMLNCTGNNSLFRKRNWLRPRPIWMWKSGLE